MEGWARFHRKIADWEWYTDPNTFRVFFHLVLMANHKDNRWKGIEVKRGQHITSIDTLAVDLKLSASKIRTALNKLKLTNEITIKTTNRFTVVTVANYELYQSKDEEIASETTSESTNKSQTNRKQIATNKNVKNVKNEKNNDFIPPTLEEVKEYHKEKSMTFDPEWFHTYYTTSDWINSKGKLVANWKLTMQTWQKVDSDKKNEIKSKPINRNRGIEPAKDISPNKVVKW